MTTASPTVLDAAQIAGISAADQAVVAALRNLAEARAFQARVYAALALDPAKRYEISQQTGEITEKQ